MEIQIVGRVNLLICGLAALVFSACVDRNTLTSEQMELQGKADDAVAGILFENEIDTKASYNIHKDGFVVIKFHDSVPEEIYTRAVDEMRSSTLISGVDAWQGGRNVCVLPGQ